MRFVFAILAAVTLASCVTPDDDRFHVGQSDRSFVIIGLAESADNTSARYSHLWRLLDGAGNFQDFDARYFFEPESNTRESIRVRGIPGEFLVFEVRPGAYALDGVYAIIRDNRVNYVADGLIEGLRPSFEVAAGEAVYLGIWEANIEDVRAVTRVWRLDEADLRAVLNSEDLVVGPVRVRETAERDVPCAPHRVNMRSQRRIC